VTTPHLDAEGLQLVRETGDQIFVAHVKYYITILEIVKGYFEKGVATNAPPARLNRTNRTAVVLQNGSPAATCANLPRASVRTTI
jgi:hypothetical protein